MTPEVQTSSWPPVATEELSSVLRDYMDVTQRLQKTHESLQREVIRLRGEVESKERELERRRRLASLGELAAGVAHEVRNPLGAIRLYNGLLRDQLGKPGLALELVEKIDAGIHAIDCIVQDTLALAPHGGQLVHRSLREIIRNAHDACEATLRERQVVLRQHFQDPGVEVPADATALQRVFINLFANAAQASPPGAAVLVRVVTEVAGQVEVRVRDQGPGVPDELIDKIFNPFFTTKENGTGLGLAIAHRLVEAHGGSLAARNHAQGGAEFVVVLPTDGSNDVEKLPQNDAVARTGAA